MPTGLGIDFGSNSVKLAVVRTGSGRPQILAACKVDRPWEGRGSAEGEPLPLPPDFGVEVKRSRTRRGGGLLGLAGRDLMMKYATVPPVPPWKLAMLMEYEIRENQATGLTDICSDFRLLNMSGKGLSGSLLALIAIAKNSYIRSMLDRASAAGLSPSAGCPSAIGLYNAYKATGKMPEKETVFLIDVGHKAIETAIVQNGELVLARSQPGGGEAFTNAIDSVMKVGAERADAFKRERAKISMEAQVDSAREQLLISTGLREGADAIFNAVRSGVMFCRVQTRSPRLDLDRLVVSGGGARVKGLVEYLEKKLGKPVELLDPAEGLDLRRLNDAASRIFEESPGEMAVAVGLAVADAEPDAWKLELLPEEFVAKRRFWSKTIWAVAAGVLLAASLAVGYVRAGAEFDEAEEFAGDVSDRLAAYQAKASEYKDALQANDELRAEVELLRSRMRYGVTIIDFLRHVRATTPEGLNIEKVFEPKEPPEEVIAAGQLAVVVEGRLDKTRIDRPFDTLNDYMKALKAEPFVAEASITTSPEADGGGAGDGGGRMRFSFRVALDPEKGTSREPASGRTTRG